MATNYKWTNASGDFDAKNPANWLDGKMPATIDDWAVAFENQNYLSYFASSTPSKVYRTKIKGCTYLQFEIVGGGLIVRVQDRDRVIDAQTWEELKAWAAKQVAKATKESGTSVMLT